MGLMYVVFIIVVQFQLKLECVGIFRCSSTLSNLMKIYLLVLGQHADRTVMAELVGTFFKLILMNT
jgi:hypothetical protein